jgi:hypothetical protein
MVFLGVKGAYAQLRTENYFAQKWMIDVNVPIGAVNQQATLNYSPEYPRYLNSSLPNLAMSSATSVGFDLEGGCFFGKYNLYGIGIGLIYQSQFYNMSADNFHVEYEATDAQSAVYRQLITSTGAIKESLRNSELNVPLVFRMKQILTKKVGFSLDAGFLVNFRNVVNYNSNAAFNYEAIYAYSTKGNDDFVHVYDDNATPLPTDWLITVQQYEAHNPKGNVDQYFDSLKARGYNVGLGVTPGNRSGSITEPTGSLGFICRPGMNFKIYERLYFYLGAYASYQIMSLDNKGKMQLADTYGDSYTSLFKAVTHENSLAYGANIGIRVFLGHSEIYIDPEDR